MLFTFRGTADLMSHCVIPGCYRASRRTWRTRLYDPTGGEGAGVACCCCDGGTAPVGRLDDLGSAAGGDALNGGGRKADQLCRGNIAALRSDSNSRAT